MPEQVPETNSILLFLKKHAPFNQMLPAHLEFLSLHLKTVFYSCDDRIIQPEDGTVETFFLIRQGRVNGEIIEGVHREKLLELCAGECFPIGALLSKRPVSLTQVAAEDTICYELKRHEFEYLLQQSKVFQDFCSRRLASLLDEAWQEVQNSYTTLDKKNSFLNTRLDILIQRQPVTCSPKTSLHDALTTMQREQVSSIAVVDTQRYPIGIFTLNDLLNRVVLRQTDINTPINRVMSEKPMVLDTSDFAYDAIMQMTERDISHICVVRRNQQQKLVGVISEKDLFTSQRIDLSKINRAIPKARSVNTLRDISHDIPALVEQLLAQGISVNQLTRLLARLVDNITRQIINICLLQYPDLPKFTWLVFGNAARNEVTLNTEQQNGILFDCPDNKNPEALRERLLPFACAVNQALAECGYTNSNSANLAHQSENCLSLTQWKKRYGNWIKHGDQEQLLSARNFYDLRCLYGNCKPADKLIQYILPLCQNNTRFQRTMTENALANRPPLGLIRDFHLNNGGIYHHTLNLDRKGVNPFVDAVRIIALANNFQTTGTIDRLYEAAEKGILESGDVDSWIDAYEFIQLLRMRLHNDQFREHRKPDDHIDPDSLNELNRRILKESFRQARKLQSVLELHYQL